MDFDKEVKKLNNSSKFFGVLSILCIIVFFIIYLKFNDNIQNLFLIMGFIYLGISSNDYNTMILLKRLQK